jgi:protein SCO1/2
VTSFRRIPPRLPLAFALGLLVLCALAWPTRAEAQRGPTLGSIGENARPSLNKTPTALTDIGIEDRSGTMVPLDIRLTSNAGKAVTLDDYVDGERPLLLVLAYYNCPQLCSLVVNGMLEGMKSAKWTAGDQYRVLVVSFDPRDGLEVAQEKQKSYLGAYGRDVSSPAGATKEGTPGPFEFTVGAESEVRRLADAIGFHYRWDQATEQYAHAAGVFVVTPQGKLATTLTGVRFAGEELQKELVSADQNLSHAPLTAVLMRCYVYDPKAGKYVVDARFIMKIAGGVCVFGIAAFVLRLTRKDSSRKDSSRKGAASSPRPGAPS